MRVKLIPIEQEPEPGKEIAEANKDKPICPHYGESFHGETWYNCPTCGKSFEFYSASINEQI